MQGEDRMKGKMPAKGRRYRWGIFYIGDGGRIGNGPPEGGLYECAHFLCR
jgi:hypothetical protein